AIHLKTQGVFNKPMLVLPADHYVADSDNFRKIISLASVLAEKEEVIVTIGVVPNRPETGYGYLRRGEAKRIIKGVEVYEVKQFVEKPDYTTALAYLTSGKYFWNSGIFIFTPEVILKDISRYLPSVYAGLEKIAQYIGTKNYPEVLASVYQELPSISIDYGVMEKTDRCIFTIPGNFGWSDVGSWESVYDLRKEERDNAENLVQGKAIAIETQSSFIFNPTTKLVVSLGTKNLLIVNTEDALLVANLKRSQDIRKVIEKLKAEELSSLL
ncbi:MAG: sugar phosphate nucleotidyltransferase, partial [Desulfobacterota bacterium]|nr:sugar phosphate nucleotidyltransferase [Thermodesulfobacteriota bacterium]